MLEFEAHQMRSLEDAPRDKFVEDLAQHLRRELPEDVAGFDDRELLDAVTVAVEQAREQRFTRQLDVRAYAMLVFGVGPYFDQHHRVAQILSDPDIPDDQRMDRVMVDMSDSDWEDASEIDEDGDDAD